MSVDYLSSPLPGQACATESLLLKETRSHDPEPLADTQPTDEPKTTSLVAQQPTGSRRLSNSSSGYTLTSSESEAEQESSSPVSVSALSCQSSPEEHRRLRSSLRKSRGKELDKNNLPSGQPKLTEPLPCINEASSGDSPELLSLTDSIFDYDLDLSIEDIPRPDMLPQTFTYKEGVAIPTSSKATSCKVSPLTRPQSTRHNSKKKSHASKAPRHLPDGSLLVDGTLSADTSNKVISPKIVGKYLSLIDSSKEHQEKDPGKGQQKSSSRLITASSSSTILPTSSATTSSKFQSSPQSSKSTGDNFRSENNDGIHLCCCAFHIRQSKQ